MNIETFVDKLYDKEFREQLISDPKAHINTLYGEEMDTGDVEYNIAVSTKDTLYIAIPHNAGNEVDIENITAAGTTGSASSVSSGGSAGSVCSTFSSASTAASVGSIGSVKT